MRLALDKKLSNISKDFIEGFILTCILFLPFSKSVAEIAIFAAGAAWLLRKCPWNEGLLIPKKYAWCYGVLFLACLLSLMNAPENLQEFAHRGIWKWSKFLILFFMCAEIFKEKERAHRLVLFFLFSMALVSLNGIYQMCVGIDLIKGYSIDVPGRLIRMKSSFASPNDLAAFYLLAIPLLLGYWIDKKKWNVSSISITALLAVFGVCFIFTLSRSAFIALVLAAALSLILFRQWKYLSVIAFAMLMAFVLSDTLRYNFITSLNFKDITVMERWSSWTVSWGMIQHHPWLGHGVNLYTSLLDSLAPGVYDYRGYAHNCYLQLWAEIGLLGLIAFVLPIVFIFKQFTTNIQSLPRTSLVLGIGLLAFIVHAFFDTHYYAMQTATLFWIFWGVLVGTLNHKSNQI